MTYEEMKQTLAGYHWDHGFDLPKSILSDKNCDLALALEIFYLGDGYTYFQTFSHNIGGTKEWFTFISTLCEDIENGRYRKSNHHYEIPLSKAQRHQVRKNKISEVFLIDI